MNDPAIDRYHCPNQACPTNKKARGQNQRQPLAFLQHRVVELSLDGRIISERVVYECTVCGHRFQLS